MSSSQLNAADRRSGYPRRSWLAAVLGAMALMATVLVAPSSAHESGNDGHISPNTNYGFEVIGRDTLEGIQDGKYTDVWSLNGFAYIGTFQDPECTTSGVFVVDMAEAIANYPDITGATVAEIKSPPDTRVNDVKAITIGDRDVLITTEEPCGAGTNGGAQSDFNINKPCPLTEDEEGNEVEKDCNRANDNGRKGEIGRRPIGSSASQLGRGGISLWDVTNPERPTPLNKSFLDFGGVHNTYPWTSADGRTYLIGTADTFDFFDTFFVDITDPKKPEFLGITGALDWFAAGAFADGQFETGNSAGGFNHDVWVNNIDGRDIAVVPYWDFGYVTLDVTDPRNPVYLGDSAFPAEDPLGRPYEGNAHAAVFGAGGDIIVGGDEDFDPAAVVVEFEGTSYPAGSANFGPALSDVDFAGEVVWTGGEGCTPDEVPAATADGQIALMQRGSCFFQDKVDSAEAQGYAGAIVANDAARGDAILTMAARDDAPTAIPSIFVGFGTGEIMKAGGSVSDAGILASGFDGWGYLRVLNNTGGDVTVPDQFPGPEPTTTIGQLGEIGYYAPAETLEAELGGENFTEFGDLTMHNVEADPTTQDITPTFDGGPRFFVSWYSLGMRAIEYRPGHFHDNSNGEGSYSWNVHEVGRFIAEDGSNFWGVHVDTVEIDGEESQIILGSDRNTGLWIFTFGCEDDSAVEGPFYCSQGTDD